MSGYVNEDGTSNTYTTIKNYVSDIKQIINSSGLFKNNYNRVITQIDSINNTVEQFNSAIVSSLKRDLIDLMNNTTDWDDLHKKLETDIKRNPKTFDYKFQQFNFNVDKVELITDDIITNMNMLMEEINIDTSNVELSAKKNKKYIHAYNDYKNSFEQDIDNLLQGVLTCEDNAIRCRNKNLEILNNNIKILYKIHARYAYNVLHKVKNNISTIVYTNSDGKKINIQLCKSQNKFIVNAIKSMLEIN